MAIPHKEFVTGERIQALATLTVATEGSWAFNPNRDLYVPAAVVVPAWEQLTESQVRRIESSPTIFIYGHELLRFLSEIATNLPAFGFRLVSHNSDAEVGSEVVSWLDEHPGVVDHLFAQNVMVNDSRVTPLPIGLGNSMWRHGLLRAVAARRASAVRWPDRAQRVVMAFSSVTHPVRARIAEAVRTKLPREILASPRRSWRFSKYLSETSQARFSVSPRGNGIDTHRTWEALYLGTVPIIDRSSVAALLSSWGAPFFPVNDWGQLTWPALEAMSPVLDDEWEALLLLSTYRAMITGQIE